MYDFWKQCCKRSNCQFNVHAGIGMTNQTIRRGFLHFNSFPHTGEASVFCCDCNRRLFENIIAKGVIANLFNVIAGIRMARLNRESLVSRLCSAEETTFENIVTKGAMSHRELLTWLVFVFVSTEIVLPFTLSHIQAHSDVTAADDFWKQGGKMRNCFIMTTLLTTTYECSAALRVISSFGASWHVWSRRVLPQCFQFLVNNYTFMDGDFPYFCLDVIYCKWERVNCNSVESQ